jgi:hypothetical protein
MSIRTHWYADDLLKQCPSKGDKYVIDEELQHTDHLFLGVAYFTFMNFVGDCKVRFIRNLG